MAFIEWSTQLFIQGSFVSINILAVYINLAIYTQVAIKTELQEYFPSSTEGATYVASVLLRKYSYVRTYVTHTELHLGKSVHMWPHI